MLTLEGHHLLSLVEEADTYDEDALVTPSWVAPGITSEWSNVGQMPTLEGDVLAFHGRRLTLRNGALVPAPSGP